MNKTIVRILKIFNEINSIPRCSGDEKALADHLFRWAEDRSYAVKRDELNNLLIKVPASPGYEQAATVVIQGHLDMVCEKNSGTDHDFSSDPITSFVEDGWLKADKTTLGADNGIALAMAVNAAEDADILHPPLELLFTVDEETGLTGANNLQEGFVEGRILINIDSEEEGVFTVGCAGGRDTRIELGLQYESAPSGGSFYELKISGLSGGHSGIDIHRQKANANLLLGRILHKLSSDIRLVTLTGGTAHNAIAREAKAVIFSAESGETELKSAAEEMLAIFLEEFSATDPEMHISLTLPAGAHDGKLMSSDSMERVIALLFTVPHGVQRMSTAIDGLVETSCNLAGIDVKQNSFRVLCSQRSLLMSQLDNITDRIEYAGRSVGANISSGNGYPAWQPDSDSALLARSKKIYRKIFGREAGVQTLHAGLECGIIGSKYPGMDMISIGPDILNPHSPDEIMNIASLEKVQLFLQHLLASFKN